MELTINMNLNKIIEDLSELPLLPMKLTYKSPHKAIRVAGVLVYSVWFIPALVFWVLIFGLLVIPAMIQDACR